MILARFIIEGKHGERIEGGPRDAGFLRDQLNSLYACLDGNGRTVRVNADTLIVYSARDHAEADYTYRIEPLPYEGSQE